jgi:hypothetical protein
MPRLVQVLALPVVLAVCSPPLERTTTVLSDTAPARTSPETTNIYDDWVLATPVDSTAFTGAERVELSLTTTAFTIAVTYPGATRVVVSGSTGRRETDGPLLLVPRSITRDGSPLQTHAGLTVGDTLALLASASGNVLVFAPPDARPGQPSSVWHRRSP